MTGLEYFIISLLLNLLIAELSPKPKLPNAKRYDLSEFSVPTATEDRSQTVPFGKNKIAGNIIWFGDYKADPIKEKVRVSPFSSQTVIKGYYYKVGMWLTLSAAPCDSIHEIRWGDRVVWTGDVILSKDQVTYIDVNSRFVSAEGQEEEEGVVGRFAFFNHEVDFDNPSTQYTPLPNPYMEQMLGVGNVPSYPNTLHCVFLGPSAASNSADPSLLAGLTQANKNMQGYVGNNPAIQPLTFVIRRQHYKNSAINPADNNLSGDANPAYAILELLTSRLPGLGPRLNISSCVDAQSFFDVAERLNAEGIGISYNWEVSRPVNELIGDLTVLTNTVLRTDPTTGKLKLQLIRPDDGPVAVFDENNIISVESFDRVAVEQAPNRVEVPFKDRQNNFAERVAYSRNTSAIAQAGTVIDTRAEFLGVSREALAVQLASREMAKVSSALAKVSFSGFVEPGVILLPGDLILFTHPTLKQTVRMRVGSSRFAGMNNAMRVQIEAIEDIFLNGFTFDTGSTPIGSNNPVVPPSSLTSPKFIYAPYALTGDDVDHGMYYAVDPGTSVDSYRLAVQETSAWQSGGAFVFEDTAQEPTIAGTLNTALSSNVNANTISVTLSNEALQQYNSQSRTDILIAIGNELLSMTSMSVAGNVLTGFVTRAIYDTLPEAHVANKSVYLLLGFHITLQRVSATAGQGVAQMTVRAESRGKGGRLDVEGAAASNATLEAASTTTRAIKPLLPGLVRMQNVVGVLSESETAPNVPAPGTAAKTITWNNRNRVARAYNGWFSGSNDAEAGVSTTVALAYKANGSQTYTNVGTANSTTNTATINVNALAPIPAGALVRVSITTTRGGVSSETSNHYFRQQ